MIRIERTSLVSAGVETELHQLRDQFQERTYLRLPKRLERLFDFIQEQIKLGEFDERVDERLDSSKELCMRRTVKTEALPTRLLTKRRCICNLAAKGKVRRGLSALRRFF